MISCPNCHSASRELGDLPIHYGFQNGVQIDICESCQLIWFDRDEECLSDLATLKVVESILPKTNSSSNPIAENLHCPLCQEKLAHYQDIYTERGASYFFCPHEHGILMSFTDFMRFKGVNTASLKQARQAKRFGTNCKQCGSPLPLESNGICTYCKANNIEMAYTPEEIASIEKTTEELADKIRSETIMNASAFEDVPKRKINPTPYESFDDTEKGIKEYMSGIFLILAVICCIIIVIMKG